MVLRAYYPLHEDSGTTAHDYSDNDNHGTINGATMGVQGINGNTAYGFNSSNGDYVETTSFNISNRDEMALSCWINADTFGTNDTILRQWVTGGSPNVFILRMQDGTLSFSLWDGSNAHQVTTSLGSTDSWYYVVALHDGETQRLYVEGVEQATNSFTGRQTGSAPIQIGRRDDNSEYFNGSICEVRIYDHSLTAQEVQYLYQVSQKGRLLTGGRKG